MEKFFAGLIVFTILVFACFGFVMLLNIGAEREAVMQEAFDRGYAVQCIGKEGYYWECEE